MSFKVIHLGDLWSKLNQKKYYKLMSTLLAFLMLVVAFFAFDSDTIETNGVEQNKASSFEHFDDLEGYVGGQRILKWGRQVNIFEQLLTATDQYSLIPYDREIRAVFDELEPWHQYNPKIAKYYTTRDYRRAQVEEKNDLNFLFVSAYPELYSKHIAGSYRRACTEDAISKSPHVICLKTDELFGVLFHEDGMFCAARKGLDPL